MLSDRYLVQVIVTSGMCFTLYHYGYMHSFLHVSLISIIPIPGCALRQIRVLLTTLLTADPSHSYLLHVAPDSIRITYRYIRTAECSSYSV